MKRAMIRVAKAASLLWMGLVVLRILWWVATLSKIEWSDPEISAQAWAVLTPGEIALQLASIATAGTLAVLLNRWSIRRLAAMTGR